MNKPNPAATPAKRRRRGRPGPSSTADVRENILNAGENLFASQGFDATSVRQIASEAAATAAMVHYYFGSKKELLQAVMERVLEPLASAIQELREQGQPDISQIVKLFLSMCASHPALPQLITREVFLPGGVLQDRFIEHYAPRLGGRLPEILQHQKAQGRCAANLDSGISSVLILSMCFFPFIARPAAERVLGVRYDTDGQQALAEHITALLQRGITP